MSESEDKVLKISSTPMSTEELLNSGQTDSSMESFITDGEGRVLSQSEKDKFWEEFKRNQEQQRYDKLYGKKKSKKKNPKSIIPEATEIPDLKPTRFEDWQITLDCTNRTFQLYHWINKTKLTPTFDDLGFRKGNKAENVKIHTLLSYAFLTDEDEKGAGFIVQHNNMVDKIKAVSTYRTYLQRVFRQYLNIEPSSKMFTRIPTLYLGKETIIYKCNAKLQQPYDPAVDSDHLEYKEY
jgi:hypothetical protein|tara:strand:+ start:51 stop:764 length:714 start_codon:yes stop_codon:yes gene_type:complete